MPSCQMTHALALRRFGSFRLATSVWVCLNLVRFQRLEQQMFFKKNQALNPAYLTGAGASCALEPSVPRCSTSKLCNLPSFFYARRTSNILEHVMQARKSPGPLVARWSVCVTNFRHLDNTHRSPCMLVGKSAREVFITPRATDECTLRRCKEKAPCGARACVCSRAVQVRAV